MGKSVFCLNFQKPISMTCLTSVTSAEIIQTTAGSGCTTAGLACDLNCSAQFRIDSSNFTYNHHQKWHYYMSLEGNVEVWIPEG